MTRIASILMRCFLLFAWLTAGQMPSSRAALASPTALCSPITTSTTWTVAGGPYDICNTGITIQAGATLTIDPGVTVTFEPASGFNRLNVNGALVALGTADQPITFTSASGSPTASDWGGIYAPGAANTPASLTLDYVNIAYGGHSGPFYGAVTADHTTLSIDHSQISSSGGHGLYATNNTIFAINNTAFSNNAQDAIDLAEPSGDLLLTGLSASGNGFNGVHLSGLSIIMTGQREIANPGVPYLVDAVISNHPGDILTIDPGTQMIFGGGGSVSIAGQLQANGLSNARILMTGQTKSPGAWRGLNVIGGTTPALAQLDYVTIEYGGSDISGADIYVTKGRLIANHSLIHFSQKDGVRFDTGAIGSILNSQIIDNTLYGVYKAVTTTTILASNNWWGALSGPTSDLPACSGGTGSKVTAGVLFKPFLTDPNTLPALPLTSAPAITLTPRRWYAPDDGVTPVYFDITLKDGNGLPIPGRIVRLATSLGNPPVDGGITDVFGHTLAYLTSNIPGDATVTATLDPINACEAALSPESKVTFTAPSAGTNLFPDAQSPYFTTEINVSPMPVVTGVHTTISARLTNSLSSPLTVDVTFGFVQSSIGLAFGPIATLPGQMIPANSSVTVSTDWVPSVSGHYCVQITYTINPTGALAPAHLQGPAPTLPQAGTSLPLNLNVYQSSTGGGGKDNSLQKTRNSLKAVNRFVDRAYSPNPVAVPLAVANAGISWDLNNAEKISNALQGDPPRQDYTLIDVPHKLELPPVLPDPGAGLSVNRAAALNALDDALAQANAYGVAAAIAFDRAGGATEAGNLQWASAQTGVMLEYNQLFGAALVTAAGKITDLVTVAANDGYGSVIIPVADVITMQQNLAVNGFSTQEKADAYALGLTDADLAAILQSILTANPNDLAGDVIVHMLAIRDSLLDLGAVLQNPQVFAPPLVVGGAGPEPVPGLAPAATGGNLMAQVHNLVTTIQLGNPTGGPALITLTARRIDLPADWNVDVSPAQVILAVGETATITVTILAGSPVPQGTRARVAVEGFTGTQLLGGVVIDQLVPDYFPFDGSLHVYLPMIK